MGNLTNPQGTESQYFWVAVVVARWNCWFNQRKLKSHCDSCLIIMRSFLCFLDHEKCEVESVKKLRKERFSYIFSGKMILEHLKLVLTGAGARNDTTSRNTDNSVAIIVDCSCGLAISK